MVSSVVYGTRPEDLKPQARTILGIIWAVHFHFWLDVAAAQRKPVAFA